MYLSPGHGGYSILFYAILYNTIPGYWSARAQDSERKSRLAQCPVTPVDGHCLLQTLVSNTYIPTYIPELHKHILNHLILTL